MNTPFIGRLLATTTALLALSLPAQACSDITLTAKDGTQIIGRTMEFGVDLKSNLRTSPRGRDFTTTTSNDKPGLQWKSTYGYIYVDGFGVDSGFDGMNEAGLSFGYLYLPGETVYQTIPDGKDSQSIPYLYFGDWVLGNFKTVAEVKEALKNVTVSAKKLPQLGEAILPAHATIRDTQGNGIIVEFYDNKINVSDSVGILTNAPKYEWQVTNLRNFVNLSPDVPKAISQGGMTYSATGMGSGAVGLPGDASPPSRFVKLAFMAANVYKADNAVDLLNQVQHIINNVDLPAGYVRTLDDGKTESDITQWALFKDITNKMFYYRTYNDMTLRGIDMSKLDFSPNAPRLVMPMSEAPRQVSVTDQFLKTGH